MSNNLDINLSIRNNVQSVWHSTEYFRAEGIVEILRNMIELCYSN